jgi:O-antigen ligase
MNMPRLRLRRWWMPLVIAPQIIALMLTLVRSSWIMLTVGVLVYLVLAPSRGRTLAGIGVLVVGVIALSTVLINSTAGAEGSSNNFITRIQTFTDLGNDVSVNTRVDITQALFRLAIAEPLGQGLGAIGLSAKLGAGGETIVVDNGYIARFIEMGFIGGAFFLASVIVSFAYGFAAYRKSWRSGNPDLTDRLAACLCIQIMFMVGQAGADVYFGSEGMFFWLAIYFASVSTIRESSRRSIAYVPAIAS